MNREDVFEIGAEVRYIPESERAGIPASDFAGPNRTFPINSQDHVHSAAMLLHHAADPSDVKKKIIAIAKRKGYSLPQAWQSGADSETGGSTYMSADTLVFMGGEVKSLGDRRVGGYGVLFTSPKDPDTYEEFFGKDTDFDIADGERRSLYYNHGFDDRIGNHKIGTLTTRKDDVGLWVEGQLKEADEYADAILGMVEAGKLGYSSGAVAHLVRREPVGKSRINKIVSWPLGEMSLTNKPAEPRAWAVPLKSLFDLPTQETPAAPDKAAVSITDIRSFEDFLRESGFPKDAAVTIASKGFNALRRRDAEESEANSDTFRKACLMELARVEIVRARGLGVAI